MEKNHRDWIVKSFKVLVLLALVPIGYMVMVNMKGKDRPTYVKITTKFGDMKVVLYDDTPIHKENFVKLVKDGFYDGTIFHRVIKDFMIQGGDPDSKEATEGQRLGNGGPGYTIDAELNTPHFHKKGALAAARKGDRINPEKKSSGSQFYIVQGKTYTKAGLESLNERKKQMDANAEALTEEQIEVYSTLGGTPHLDGSYTVFGEVVEGMNIIDSIANVATKPGDRPLEDVVMSMKIVKK